MALKLYPMHVYIVHAAYIHICIHDCMYFTYITYMYMYMYIHIYMHVHVPYNKQQQHLKLGTHSPG